MAIGITFHPSAVTESMKKRLETLYAEHLKSGSECVESMSEFTPQSIQKTAEVTADTLLLTIEPESSGENGVNVFGAQIAAATRSRWPVLPGRTGCTLVLRPLRPGPPG